MFLDAADEAIGQAGHSRIFDLGLGSLSALVKSTCTDSDCRRFDLIDSGQGAKALKVLDPRFSPGVPFSRDRLAHPMGSVDRY